MSKPRVVQVFECPTLPSKRQETAPRTKPKQGEELSHNQLVDEDFQKAVSEVRDFSMKNTTGKDKKKKEIERVVALGGKAPKQQKMPYNMLMAIKKKGAQRQNMRDEQASSGVVLGKKKSSNKVPRRSKSDAGTFATKGRLKNGVLFISKKDR
ncbi:hypothetical protein Ae201684_018374 [Aphanomyces euteiches]|uniref:Uncharacterized protein n=1 Tax=Aphanomyces euteiches TaxID=100861 RepID=A0A6G0W622_9STRA|nr:hypothetical protein Ae201684_018374 [Aphanomyces euteiches]KAH9140006.1 hypothetical protein AeRB84_015731 [Aphanomyces euteiches]